MKKTIEEYARQINNKVLVLGYNKQEVEVVGKMLRELAEDMRKECAEKLRKLQLENPYVSSYIDLAEEIESIEIK